MVVPISILPGFGWNAQAGRYVDLETGLFVSKRAALDALEFVIEGARLEISTLSQQLQSGLISLEQWQTAMMSEIKLINVSSAALANGGWAQMSPSDWGFTGNLIKDQYKFLDGLSTEIFTGEQPLNGTFLRRADMYGQSGRGTYEEVLRRYQQNENGMTEERRVLGGSTDNCNGCLEQASRGWQPIGTLDAIGEEECATNCRCEFEYR